MKLLLVCGPFGSGTTAVAGLLARLGAIGFGPYYRPADERTPDSHELIAFRDLMLTLASEETTTLLPGADVKTALDRFRDRIANQELGAYDDGAAISIFLKHPLAALIIPQICAAFETRLIYLVRPVRDIEASRRRRKWGAQYGAKAAGIIYSHMFNALINHAYPTTIVRYAELIERPLEHARRLAAFAGLKGDADVMREAATFVRGRQPPSPVTDAG
jgi:Sulfotransferase domain